jgi:hypothetical protein
MNLKFKKISYLGDTRGWEGVGRKEREVKWEGGGRREE